MNGVWWLVTLIKKKRVVPIEQTKPSSQETLLFKMNTSRQAFIFDTPLILEGDK